MAEIASAPGGPEADFTPNTTVTVSVRATPLGVRHALESIQNVLTGWRITPDHIGTAQIVLAEVMNNIVEHAHAELPESHFELSLSALHDGLGVHAIDGGAPMPGGVLPKSRGARLNVDFADLPEGGFGWGLINTICTGLCYERANGLNHLRFTIPNTVH
jgi:serine/threonine-protein kinase RsbW